MLAEMNIPEVVDLGAGCQWLTQHLGLVVGVAVGGRLAFMVLRITLRDFMRGRWEARHRSLIDSADVADEYDLEDAQERRSAARMFYLRGRRRHFRRKRDM